MEPRDDQHPPILENRAPESLASIFYSDIMRSLAKFLDKIWGYITSSAIYRRIFRRKNVRYHEGYAVLDKIQGYITSSAIYRRVNVLYHEGYAVLESGWSFLEQYGWYLLLAAIILYFLWNKMRPGLERWRRQREDATFYGKYTAEQLQEREEVVRRARERMQAELNAKTEPFIEEQRRKEEEKRNQKIDNWERHQEGRGYRSKYRPPEDGNNSGASGSDSQPKPRKRQLRPPDYNPLMGDSSGFSYRPPRSSSGGGG